MGFVKTLHTKTSSSLHRHTNTAREVWDRLHYIELDSIFKSV